MHSFLPHDIVSGEPFSGCILQRHPKLFKVCSLLKPRALTHFYVSAVSLPNKEEIVERRHALFRVNDPEARLENLIKGPFPKYRKMKLSILGLLSAVSVALLSSKMIIESDEITDLD